MPADRRSARQARNHTRAALDAWGLEHIADVVVLLTSELVTNAVLHTGTPIDLTVKRPRGKVRVEVADRSDEPPHLRHPRRDDESGRGLALVDALALQWGTTPTRSGKLVWFEVAR